MAGARESDLQQNPSGATGGVFQHGGRMRGPSCRAELRPVRWAALFGLVGTGSRYPALPNTVKRNPSVETDRRVRGQARDHHDGDFREELRVRDYVVAL